MARIRTIKPEFPQSESIGRLSRDARLLFIQLFTLADDSGRARGNSRILASLLYPYDDDAIDLIDGWLAELCREQMIDLYAVDGSKYLQVRKWLIHQKIDKASPSKIPEFVEASRVVGEGSPTVREFPAADHRIIGSRNGSRIKDQGMDHLCADVARNAHRDAHREIWGSYSSAYRGRYGTEPVRNAKTAGQVAQLRKRLGDDAAPVSAYFVSSNAQWYVTKGHAIGVLLSDAEKLHTEWQTGMRITHAAAAQMDRSQNAMDAVDRVAARLGAI